MRIETATGKGVIEILRMLSEGNIKMSEMISVLHPVIKSGGNDLTEKDVGQLVWQSGLTEGIREVSKVMSEILNSSEADEGNAQEAEQA